MGAPRPVFEGPWCIHSRTEPDCEGCEAHTAFFIAVDEWERRNGNVWCPICGTYAPPHESCVSVTDQLRDARFGPGNDALWGEGNWVRCSSCPPDRLGNAVYHHRDAHPLETP